MNFKTLTDLIHRRTGLEVPDAAPYFEQMTVQRLQELGCQDINDYVALLRARGVDDPEWAIAIQNATNRLTHFLRDEEQLAAAISLATAARALHGQAPVRIWSAGCSTGEEPYTLAILALEVGLEATVLGTDINPLVLRVAKHGVFSEWALRRVPGDIRSRHFKLVQPGTYEIRRHVAERVSFTTNNLVKDEPPTNLYGNHWHLILCRNVLIYYKEETIRTVVSRFSRALAPHGFLALGASETLAQRQLPLRPYLAFGRVVYGRSEDREPSLSVLPEVQDLTDRGRRRSSRPAKDPAPASETKTPATAAQLGGRQPLRSNAAPRDDESAEIPELPASYLQIQDSLLRCLEENRSDAVLEALKEVVRSNPDDIHARLSLGHVLLREHDFEEARTQYEAAIALDDVVAEGHFFLGLLNRKARQPEQAMTSLRRAVFLEPEFWLASYLLGITAKRLGEKALSNSEMRRTRDLLTSSRGTLPLITHPLFHSSFLEDADEVLQAALEALREGEI